jgi:hypothetical protein
MRKWAALVLLLVLLVAAQANAQTNSAGVPSANSMTFVAVSCGTTSTPFGQASRDYLTVNIPPTVTQTAVWFSWGINAGTGQPNAATVGPPSQAFVPGQTLAWAGGTGSCIVASGTATITVGVH